MEYIRANPKAEPWLPYILAKTLGEELGSNNLSALWGLLARFTMMHKEDVVRAGYQVSPLTGEEIFKKIDDYRWMIPRSYKEGMRTDALIYTDEAMLQHIFLHATLLSVSSRIRLLI
jgi:hypothetical protein